MGEDTNEIFISVGRISRCVHEALKEVSRPASFPSIHRPLRAASGNLITDTERGSYSSPMFIETGEELFKLREPMSDSREAGRGSLDGHGISFEKTPSC